MVANKYFILLLSWMLVGGQGFSSNLDHSYPGKKKHPYLLNMWLGRPNN
jgi:hypothetical protein